MKKIIIGIVSFIAVILLFSSIVITYDNEYKLIRQFGKVDRVINTSGISFKIPFVEEVDTLPRNIILYDIAPSDVITQDKKTMVTDSYILWKIVDPLKFAQSLSSSVDNAQKRIDTVVYNSLKNVIGSLNQNEIIGKDAKLSEQIMNNIGNTMEQYGILILSVETKRMDLPSDNKEAVYNRMISEREKIAVSYTAEGNSESQIIKNTTDREVTIMISEAEAEAASLIAEGEAEYMKILASAYSDPSRTEFYSFVRSLDAAKISFTGDNKTLILPANSPMAQIFMGQ